jgi:hypothetical protein
MLLLNKLLKVCITLRLTALCVNPDKQESQVFAEGSVQRECSVAEAHLTEAGVDMIAVVLLLA